MNTELMCFADNTQNVKAAFSDYMSHYFSEVEKRDGYFYDNSMAFSEKEAKVDALMKAEITKLSGVTFTDGKVVSKEMWSTHPMLSWASFAVANALIDMVLPETIDKSIGIYTEQRYGQMGDSFSFDYEPNDLFYISKAGRNQRTVEFQKQFSGQSTIVPENREITVSVNFYKVLCGKESLAKFVSKAILSIESQITKEVYAAFNAAMSDLPATPVDNALNVSGYSQTSAVSLAQKVSAFNHNAKAVFMGTQLALQNILPDDANYRYTLDSEYATLGYVRNAFGFDTMVLPQIADWKTPYKLALDDNKIYVISPSSQKIVKLCYEGSSYTNPMEARSAADLTETTTITKSWGIGIGTNAIAGQIEIA